MKRKYGEMTKYTPSDKSKGYKKKKKYVSNDHMLLMKLKKNVFQHEKKFVDVQESVGGNLYSLSNAASITLLNGITQGVDENTRIGRQMNMKSIYLRGNIQSSSTTTGTGVIRTIIVLDKEVPQSSSTGQTMAITDFLVGNDINSLNNLNNRKRFLTLHDEFNIFAGSYVGGTSVQTTGNPTSHVLNWYKNVDITCEFNSQDNGTIADFTKNALYLITYSSGLSGGNLQGTVNTRIRFTDN